MLLLDHCDGALSFHLGKFQAAHDRLQQILKAVDYRRGFHSEIYGINVGVFCRAYIAHCEWHLGYPDRALATAEEGLSLAREVGHPFNIAVALDYLAMLHQFRREPEAAHKFAEEAGSHCAEYRFDYYGAWSAPLRAWCIAERTPFEDAAAAYDASLDEFRKTGALLRMPHYLGLLATIYCKTGRQGDGLRLVGEAAQIADRTLEGWCDAELERERGELLLIDASDSMRVEAEAAFKRAIDIAVSQGAKMLELRACSAIARLWAKCSEDEKAFDVLAPIYGWFSEGFETPDLREARTLLGKLRSALQDRPGGA